MSLDPMDREYSRATKRKKNYRDWWDISFIVFGVTIFLFVVVSGAVALFNTQCPAGEHRVCTESDCRVEPTHVTIEDISIPITMKVCQNSECHCEKNR